MQFWSRFRSSRRAPPGARRLRRSAEVVSAADGDRTVLLDLRSEQYFALDGVGAAVWARLEGDRTVEEVAAAVAELYQAPRDEVQRDVIEFVTTLERDGLAEECR